MGVWDRWGFRPVGIDEMLEWLSIGDECARIGSRLPLVTPSLPTYQVSRLWGWLVAPPTPAPVP
jgi:hypothetical protein